ncbi:hypothetical protein TNCT_361161 [Trichonephila clavata]|uniref:Uncharacterized protein n=1 Tax=Trichonephila clavata TaxID=2740835 RepID=A0A8X6HDJ5_TRICU|nr:hypothetical protein TNCT_361161 [Trichonephila clavata]
MPSSLSPWSRPTSHTFHTPRNSVTFRDPFEGSTVMFLDIGHLTGPLVELGMGGSLRCFWGMFSRISERVYLVRCVGERLMTFREWNFLRNIR